MTINALSMRIVVLTFCAIAMSGAQRPSYLGIGEPIGRPGLAHRFKTNETEAEEQAALANRFGASTGNGAGMNAQDTAAIGGAAPAGVPVDARGDQDLVDRLNQWPRENQPFWLLNAAAIEAQRNKVDAGATSGGQTMDVGNRNSIGINTAGQQSRPKPQATNAHHLNVGQTAGGGDFDSFEDVSAEVNGNRFGQEVSGGGSNRQPVVGSRPITPPPPRSSFLGPVGRRD